MNEFSKDKPTSQQLVDLIDEELDITISRDVVYGLDFEYKQLQNQNNGLKQERDKYKSIVEEAIKHISNEFLCYDNESDEYIQGLKAIEILKELEEGEDNV